MTAPPDVDDCGTGHSETWEGIVRKVLVDADAGVVDAGAGATAAHGPVADAKEMKEMLSRDVPEGFRAASRLELCAPGLNAKICLDSGRWCAFASGVS